MCVLQLKTVIPFMADVPTVHIFSILLGRSRSEDLVCSSFITPFKGGVWDARHTDDVTILRAKNGKFFPMECQQLVMLCCLGCMKVHSKLYGGGEKATIMIDI